MKPDLVPDGDVKVHQDPTVRRLHSARVVGSSWNVQLVPSLAGVYGPVDTPGSDVQDGPFALVRHPIYVALFGLMLATALALGHVVNLIVAIPLYLWGTLSRVAIEERLLRNAFGDAYDVYAKRVKRFVPGVW